MGDTNSSVINKRRIPGRIILLVAVAIVLLIVVSLIIGYVSGASWFSAMFSQRMPELTVDGFYFDIGRSRMFANIDGSVAAVGTLGVQVFDAAGNETLREPFRLAQPVIVSSGERCIAFDVGGTSIRVFNRTQVLSSIETDSAIVSASINGNGWFCVVTQGGGGAKGAVAVHDNTGAVVFKVNLFTGFALSAHLSADNNNLAVLTLPDTGSRIMLYQGISEDKDPDHQFDFFDRLIIDMFFLPNGDILALSTDSLILAESSGDRSILYAFPDNRLGGYTKHNDFIALHLYDFGVGFQGRLVTLDFEGMLLGELVTNREIISLSAFDKTLVVLKNDGIVFYSEDLESFFSTADNHSAAGASRVLVVREHTVLAASDNSAVLIKAVAD